MATKETTGVRLSVLDVVDAIAEMEDGAWVGRSEDDERGLLLIAVLIDQADFSLTQQAMVRRVLGLPDIGRDLSARGGA